MADEASQSLSLKILVDEETNRVVFAESNNDFVDVLFSLMTMPIGTIIRLSHEQASKWEIGCLNNLYESIENFDDKLLQPVECKDMLLRPRSAAEIYCRDLKLNSVHSTTNEYYACGYETTQCTLFLYRTAHCRCGRPIKYMVKLENRKSVPPVGGVFVKPTSRFMITDDFQVLPMSTMTCLTLLKELGAVDGSTIKERCINIGKDEVLKLFKASLTSMAPFSETVLESQDKKTSFAIHHGELSPRSTIESQRAMDTTRSTEVKIAFKLIINKCNNRALYVEAREDFVNLINSFLTFPLGYVFKEFPCLSLRGCLANLYKSILALDVDEFFKSEEMKATLVNPKLPHGIAYNKLLIPIEEALYPSWSTVSSLFGVSYFNLTEATTGERFMKGPSKYMVTDNLTITPLSPLLGLSLINKLNIPFSDIVEREVTIGEEEALRLLEAALVSRSALTDAFILKEPKQKPQGNISHLDA
ncbi:uncharacterized protein LOC132294410 isoform X1 [Cornus florida]|uniref:uncharacterized protein LOC132294410 isoform X1 n=1 Tax=Cornus florida TaxID=4283 RepID=UPI0028974600|nr:uncharacterized protein LOC132294410 isoform X1 [Cornus florida]XP_059648239.1 uncharacterized protein LOC132294410 isoform X1 [Cornus florida]